MFYLLRLIIKHGIQIKLGDSGVMLIQKILLRSIRQGPGGQDGGAVGNLSVKHSRTNLKSCSEHPRHTRVIHDEGVGFMILGIGAVQGNAVAPVAEENKVIWFGAIVRDQVPPEFTYSFESGAYWGHMMNAVFKGLREVRPEIKTVGLVWGATDPENRDNMIEILEKWDFEVVATSSYESALTTDFYPVLTPLVAQNPDAIHVSGGPAPEALQTKQLRELGYTGHIFSYTGVNAATMIGIAGAENVEGWGSDFNDYSSDLYPEKTQELYQDFLTRYPGVEMDRAISWGFGTLDVIAQAIEAAQSIDPTAVRDQMHTPGWTFEVFGMEGVFGGEQTYGIRAFLCVWEGYTEIINGKTTQLTLEGVQPLP